MTNDKITISKLAKQASISQQNTEPLGAVEGEFWLDTSDNTFQGTVFQELTTQLADISTLATKYGAVGDGITINTTKLQQAIDYATQKGHKLWLPNGVFLTGKLNLTCDIDGVGTLKFLNTGTVYDCLSITTNGVTVNNITLDGNRIVNGTGYDGYKGTCGIYVTANDVSIFNVKIKNTFTMGIYAGECNRLKIAHCDIQNIKGNYGDGIFLTGCVDSQVLYNKVQDYTRIGIVTEGNTTVKSKNISIIGNWIYNGHDASVLTGGGEYNSGIWCENTLGTTITHNTIKQNTHYGIIVVPIINDNKVYSYLIDGNNIRDCNSGIVWGGDLYGDTTIINNNIYGTYTVGVSVGTKDSKNVLISNCYFNDTTLTGLGQALILFDCTNVTTYANVKIDNCKKGTITYVTEAIDISVTFTGQKLNLVISDMIGSWSFGNWDAANYVGTLDVYNTELNFPSSSHIDLGGFTTHMYFTNCKVSLGGNRRLFNVADIKFINCSISSSTLNNLTISGSVGNILFSDCVFNKILIEMATNNSQLTKMFLKSCEFNEYRSYGAINGTPNPSNWELYVYEVTFKDSNSYIPIQINVYAPVRTELRNVFSPVQPISGFAATLVTGVGGSGKATITSGTTSVTVTHGLGYTPTKVLCTPFGNVGNVWVTNATNTAFTINCSTAPGTNTDISWSAGL